MSKRADKTISRANTTSVAGRTEFFGTRPRCSDGARYASTCYSRTAGLSTRQMPATGQDVVRFSRLLEQRLTAVRLLYEVLEQSLTALVGLDFAAVEECVARRSQLCHAITVIDARLARIGRRSESSAAFVQNLLDSEADTAALAHLRNIVEELRRAQKQTAQLSEAVAEQARRCCTSDAALVNVISRLSSITYANPLERFSNAEGA